jgi:transcriptional regulator GlxA family with amidase domain
MGELTLDKLARLACMNRFSFCRAFKERFSQSFISYVNSIRLKNAGELLKDSRTSITEIAFSVGYRNSGHFNRVFKAIYKMSPREYRRKMICNSDQNV